MMYESGNKFGERSLKVLAELHPDLRVVMGDALRMCEVDFGLVDGARTIEQQRAYFKDGKSKVNPDAYPDNAALYKAAKHITGPGMPHSRAVDIVVGAPGLAYDLSHLCYIAGIVMACARQRGITIRWGGNFNRDGVILEQAFDDNVHFEID